MRTYFTASRENGAAAGPLTRSPRPDVLEDRWRAQAVRDRRGSPSVVETLVPQPAGLADGTAFGVYRLK
jgi:hypothetical protein